MFSSTDKTALYVDIVMFFSLHQRGRLIGYTGKGTRIYS